MLGGPGENAAKALASTAVQFAVKGNEQDVQDSLPAPTLPAKLLYQDKLIDGYHQGSRRTIGEWYWTSPWTSHSTLQASGEGTFISPELTYHGAFRDGKFHDTTGQATCYFGSTERYIGCFEDGHLSGQGVLERKRDQGRWTKVFEGHWLASKPVSGKHYDSDGVLWMVTVDGRVTAGGKLSRSLGDKMELLTALRNQQQITSTATETLNQLAVGITPEELFAMEEEHKRAVNELLLRLQMTTVILNGDASVLLELQKLDALGWIPSINQLYNIKVDADTRTNMTALAIAAQQGHTDVVKVLLQVPAINVNHQNEFGTTALMGAACYGCTDTVQALIADDRVNVNLKNKDGHTALMLACHSNHTPAVHALLASKKLDVNFMNEDGDNALIFACCHGSPAVVQALVRDGRVDLNQKDANGQTALMKASHEGAAGAVKALLADKRVDVNAQNATGLTALMIASHLGHTSVVEALLADERVDVNLSANNGITALFAACQKAHTAVVKALLADKRTEVNAKRRGYTVLMIASSEGHAAIVQALLAEKRVDVNAKTEGGDTALSFAKTKEIETMLRTSGAKDDQSSSI